LCQFLDRAFFSIVSYKSDQSEKQCRYQYEERPRKADRYAKRA
jgi:hypothetical protein